MNRLSYILLLVFVFSSCSSYSSKGLRRLDVYSSIYDTDSKITAELYKNEMITPLEKEEFKLLAIRCWVTYNIAVDSLKVYSNTKSNLDKQYFQSSFRQYIINFAEFNDYFTKIVKRYGIKAIHSGHWQTEYPESFFDSNTMSDFYSE